jgi:hypothetical protein
MESNAITHPLDLVMFNGDAVLSAGEVISTRASLRLPIPARS